MSWVETGTCPQCGSPIYTESPWMSVLPPPSRRSCGCGGSQGQTYRTSTATISVDTSGRQLIPLAELTDKEREQIRQMIQEEFQSMKTQFFKEFEQYLAQQFRLGTGVNHGA